MNNVPHISIILVVWNSGNSIQMCLDSLLKQNMGDFEIILVDNGSDLADLDGMDFGKVSQARLIRCV